MSGLFETLSGAKGLRAEGQSAQNIAEFNAQVAEQEGKAAQLRAGFAQKRQAKAGVAIQSALEAKLGQAGGIGSQVAADLAGEQARESELENLLIGFEGETAFLRAKNVAASRRFEGQLARQQGKSAARRASIGFGLQLGALAIAAGAGKGLGKKLLGKNTLLAGQAGPTQPGLLTGFLGRR